MRRTFVHEVGSCGWRHYIFHLRVWCECGLVMKTKKDRGTEEWWRWIYIHSVYKFWNISPDVSSMPTLLSQCGPFSFHQLLHKALNIGKGMANKTQQMVHMWKSIENPHVDIADLHYIIINVVCRCTFINLLHIPFAVHQLNWRSNAFLLVNDFFSVYDIWHWFKLALDKHEEMAKIEIYVLLLSEDIW